MTTLSGGPDFEAAELGHSEDSAEYWLKTVSHLVSRWRLLIAAPAVAGLLAIAVVLVLPKSYKTSFSFTPVSPSAGGLPASALAGLAGQFGVTLPVSDPSSSPEFYVHLMRSDDVLRAIIETEYTVLDGKTELKGDFIDLYEIDKGERGKTLEEAIRVVRTRIIQLAFNTRTSIVTVSVETKWPEMSLQMSDRMLAVVDSFNMGGRQSVASRESAFLASRADTARRELSEAEFALQRFLERNRTYESDPKLAFEFSRLQREVGIRQSVHSAILQSFEQARLAAVHNTPTVSLVEHPTRALRFERRRTLPKAIMAAFVVFILVASWLLTERSWVQLRLRQPSATDELIVAFKSLSKPRPIQAPREGK